MLLCEQRAQAGEGVLPGVFADEDLEIRPTGSSERVQATFDISGIPIGDN
jgi:hypothetical protein